MPSFLCCLPPPPLHYMASILCCLPPPPLRYMASILCCLLLFPLFFFSLTIGNCCYHHPTLRQTTTRLTSQRRLLPAARCLWPATCEPQTANCVLKLRGRVFMMYKSRGGYQFAKGTKTYIFSLFPFCFVYCFGLLKRDDAVEPSCLPPPPPPPPRVPSAEHPPSGITALYLAPAHADVHSSDDAF